MQDGKENSETSAYSGRLLLLALAAALLGLRGDCCGREDDEGGQRASPAGRPSDDEEQLAVRHVPH